MLYNPGPDMELTSGGELIFFKSGESRLVDGDTAYQILTNQNTGLQAVEVQPVIPSTLPQQGGGVVPLEPVVNNYEAMTYVQLRAIASSKGIFKIGMKKAELVSLLNES